MKEKSISNLIIIRKYEQIIAGVLMIITAVVLTGFFLVPNINKARLIFTQRNKLTTRLNTLKKKADILSSMEMDFYKVSLSNMNRVLPYSKDYISLINTFDNLQVKTGVTLLMTDFQLGIISTSTANIRPARGKEAQVLPIILEIAGNISQFQQFFDSFTDLNGRIITIDEAQITFKGGGLLNARLTGKTYFYPPPETIGSLDSPLLVITEQQKEILDKINSLSTGSSSTPEIKDVDVGKKNLFN